MASDRLRAVPPPLPTRMPPVLGEYELLAKIARGGMATVYVARKSGAAGFERLVALKVCHAHLSEDEEFVSMFLDEARLAASIRHPNVVGTLDVSDADTLYLVMEYIEGVTLASVVNKALRDKQRIPPGVALRVMMDALTGLHAAHELRDASGEHLGLVHRDVSPQNVIVGVDGASRITDFGIAYAAARSTVTNDGRIKGKFSYLSPEQVKSEPATRQMDVFSAGIVLWEALTQRTLFRRATDVGTIQAMLQEPILPPSSFVPDLPAGVDAVVLEALERDPAKRYATAADFAEAIDSLRVEGMTMRGVATYVESTFRVELDEVRRAIREPADGSGRARTLPGRSISSDQLSRVTPAGSEPSSSPSKSSIVAHEENDDRDRADGDSIEHRRLRGAIAAAMLLLVGSALGLLWSRVAPSVPAQPAPAGVTAAAPAENVRRPMQAPTEPAPRTPKETAR
jgi:serine/threonine protein kinase